MWAAYFPYGGHMDIEVRLLRYFVAVAEEKHITRAAERLGIQQPPLSQQIRALEQRLGVQLFHRKARGVETTYAGNTLLVEARAALAQIERAVESTRRAARGEQGRLSVGMAPTAPFHPLMPQAIRAFREAFPGVDLTLDEALTDELVTLLRAEHIDVAFVRNRLADADELRVDALLEEPMLVALPLAWRTGPGHSHGAVELAQLARQPFVVYGPPGSGIHDATLAACLGAGFVPRVVQLAPRITSALGLVAAGLGVTLVPQSMRRINMDGVAYRPIADATPPTVVLHMVTRRHDPSVVVRNFVGMTTASFRRGRKPAGQAR